MKQQVDVLADAIAISCVSADYLACQTTPTTVTLQQYSITLQTCDVSMLEHKPDCQT
jgi:hypothetical protein